MCLVRIEKEPWKIAQNVIGFKCTSVIDCKRVQLHMHNVYMLHLFIHIMCTYTVQYM